ncbi:exo-beta-N-acetylmuramidase NamZ family protein [Capnocytophaga stomatis]|uniref:Exo-beta-N-acetylmuramidase NamZ domain-containing protein n=1 Tax=Capnocytophaga stomatis TaxID=1848904 RepID=A0ABW8QCC6_9FLAO
MSIIITPTAMATIAILIIGEDTVLLSDFEKIIRRAMKNGKFNRNFFIRKVKNTIFLLFLMASCKNNGQKITNKAFTPTQETSQEIILGANRMDLYLTLLQNKKVGIVTNQTGIVKTQNGKYVHLVDTLLKKDVKVIKVFAPEHGFRGQADAGEVVKDGKDSKTGLPIVSLYGKNKKPTKEQLADLDVVLFDLQDVGVRFYTYISTLHYVMEACAEQQLPVVVLDRPNPNAHYIDGPVLEPEFKSFIGMHPVPVVYAMTIGEYGQMINGEKWLNNNLVANLKVIPLANYTHQTPYSLPVKPSPNLPNDVSINLYPSLCFFEGTNISMGRGTSWQFQVYGSPYLENTSFSFTPKPNEGDKKPMFNGKVCYGEDLRNHPTLSKLNFTWLKKALEQSKGVKMPFFTSSFNKIAGNATLKQQIIDQKSDDEIRKTWQPALDKFKQTRKKYLIYK